MQEPTADMVWHAMTITNVYLVTEGLPQ